MERVQRREEAKNFKHSLREKDAMNWKDSGRRKKYWAVVHSRRFPKGDQDPNTQDWSRDSSWFGGGFLGIAIKCKFMNPPKRS